MPCWSWPCCSWSKAETKRLSNSWKLPSKTTRITPWSQGHIFESRQPCSRPSLLWRVATDPWSRQCPCSFAQHSRTGRQTAGQSSWKHFKTVPSPCPALPTFGVHRCSSGMARHGYPCRSEAGIFTSVAKGLCQVRAGGALCLLCPTYGYLFFTVMLKRMYVQFTFSLEIQ